MNTARKLMPAPRPVKTNIIQLVPVPEPQPRRTTSLYKSNGTPKATAADPIREPAHIRAMQDYYLSRNQLRNYTIFTLGLLFGLRAGDLLALRMHHILTPDHRFKAHCDLIESKTRKFNNPALTPQICELLTAYLNTLPSYTLEDPLFMSSKTNLDGTHKPLTIQQLTNIIKEAARACGVPGHISTHSLRKTFAYHMIKANPNNDEVKFALQTMLNHNDFKTTLTYCGLTQDAVDRYRENVGEYLFA